MTSRLEYGNAVLYGITDRLIHRLEMAQHRAVSVVQRSDRQQRIMAGLKFLYSLPVKWRTEYKIVILVFSVLHNQTPAYFTDHTLRTAPVTTISRLRPSNCAAIEPCAICPAITLPCKTTSVDALPEELRLVSSMDAFKARLKTHYFKLAFKV